MDMVQEAINESGFNSVLSWMRQYDIACITAFRDEFKNSTPRTLDDRPQKLIDADRGNGIYSTIDKTPYKYSLKEKVLRNRDLKAILLSLGYGVTNINGNYIENYGTINAIELGEGSFLVVNLKNDSDFKKHIFELSEYYNQDCFLFKPKGSDEAYSIGTNYGEYPGYGNEVNLGVLHINIYNEFHLDVYENYSRGSRMSIRSIYERTEKHLTELNNNAIKTFAVFPAENHDLQDASDKVNFESLMMSLKDSGYVCLPSESANTEHLLVVVNISLQSCKAFGGYYQRTSFIYHIANADKFVAQYWEKKDMESPYNHKSNDYVQKEENIVASIDCTKISVSVDKNRHYSIPFSIFDKANARINENLDKMVAYRKAKYDDNRSKDQYIQEANRIGIYERRVEKPINVCMRKAINRGLL